MDVNQAAAIELSPVSFIDVDQFMDWEIGLGWDIESLQLSAGANAIRFDHFAFPEILVGHYTSRQQTRHLFSVPVGVVVFLICQSKRPLVWCGREMPPTLLPVVRAGREHEATLSAGWDCYEFMATEDLIRRTEIFPPSFFDETVNLERAFLPLTEPITSQFLRMMDTFFALNGGAEGSANRVVDGDRLFGSVIDGLRQVIDAGLNASDLDQPRTVRRADLVAKGTDFVAANLTAKISADDMAQALGVSSRVLNYAFQDSLGLSPYRYIMTQKLHAIRRQLKASKASVTEACFAHGFNNPSRFARHYERLFGELPSQTRYTNGWRPA